ncbi:hypothetical protein RRG08_044761 [Elysia crispata]|uniref:Uncharacterized protein n=1 Tax=Elysia crispata TaxID=231223 RepID=A0AAE0ZIL2_9GAST|nr:hypothetical protein RRG08_044761 [Elysia crispata]
MCSNEVSIYPLLAASLDKFWFQVGASVARSETCLCIHCSSASQAQESSLHTSARALLLRRGQITRSHHPGKSSPALVKNPNITLASGTK